MEKKVYTFDDVIGNEEAKKEFLEIKDFILNPKKFANAGAIIPQGILVAGQPGVGKTFMVSALLAQLNIPIYTCNKEGIDLSLEIKAVFDKARQNKPCIIFLDELDKMFGGIFSDDSSVLRQLLLELDGYDNNNGILVIATVNSVENISSSLFRSGRFDRKIELSLPNLKEREEMFTRFCNNKKISKDVSFQNLAKKTPGLSAADINNIINEAILMSLRSKHKEVTSDDFEVAIDRVILGALNGNKLSKKEKRTYAIHEIGHALISCIKFGPRSVDKICITSRKNYRGYTRVAPSESSYEIATANIIIALGGRAAEELFLRQKSLNSDGDLKKAIQIVDDLITVKGVFGLEYLVNKNPYTVLLSPTKQEKIENLQANFLNECYEEAKNIINSNIDLYSELYIRLFQNEVLYTEEIVDIMSHPIEDKIIKFLLDE